MMRQLVPSMFACSALLLTACGTTERGPNGNGPGSSGSGGASAPLGGGGASAPIGGDGMAGAAGVGSNVPAYRPPPTNAAGGAGGHMGCPNPPAMWNVSGIVSGVISDGVVSMTAELALRAPEDGPGYADELRASPSGLIALGETNVWDIEPGEAPRWHSSGAYFVEDILAGDFDGDDDADLVTSDVFFDGDVTMGYVLTVWERGESGLELRAELPASVPQMPLQVAARDLEGDGDLDLITFEDGVVVIQRNDGDFAFERVAGAATETYDQYSRAHAVVVEDRDADGDADVVVLLGDGELEVLTFSNLGDLQLSAPVVQRAVDVEIEGHEVDFVRTGDVTGDGLSDFVLTVSNDGLLISSSAEGSTVDAKEIIDYATAIKLVDFDGDGMLDIVARSGELRLLLSRGNGELDESVIDLVTYQLADFEITPAAGEQAARIDALYKLPCPQLCDAGCRRCMLNACVECLTHSDCTTGSCVTHRCVDGEPRDADAGIP